MAYVPGAARVGEPTPQTDPDLFTAAEIRAEVKYLARLNRKYGPHPLRGAAINRLLAALDARHTAGAAR